jgi:D-alanyl-D-alanine carboxypeptidase/D-alanyl-D-alanine-endopeptidase (penicillin-binding protein 4)
MILAGHRLTGPGTAVRVYDLTAARPIYTLNWNTLLTPASNEKLVTSAAGLVRWGAAHRFATALYLGAPGPDANGVLQGDIYLKGYGDPSLSTSWYQSYVLGLRTANLGNFVARLQALGVKTITGRVIGDESYFDRARRVPSWLPSEFVDCGPLSALSLNEGTGSNGRAVADPSLWAASELTVLLRNAGIAVHGAASTGAVPVTAALRSTTYSAPLSGIIAAMNKPSDNFFAEELVKGLGAAFQRAGSTAAGILVMTRCLLNLGIPAAGFRLYDGSGLSYADKLTANSISRLLAAMTRRPDYPAYWRSLSIAGVDGTLRLRMRHTRARGNLHAKTGTLIGVSSLSGYVTSADHHHLVLVILMNRKGLDVGNAEATQDAIAAALAQAVV